MNKDYSKLPSLLLDIVDNRGKSVPTVDFGFPLIATNCIKHGSIYPAFENVRYVDKVTKDSWFRGHPKPNDIIFVNKGTPGRVCLVPDPVSFCFAQDMIGFRCNPEKIDFEYLFAILRSDFIQKKITNFHVGLAIPHFKKGDLYNLEIPRMASRKDERAIGQLYISLSTKIELNNRINIELEAMAKTLYDFWFVQFDFPNTNGKPYKSSGGRMTYNPTLNLEIPEGWMDGTLNDLGEVVGGSTPSTINPNNFSENGIAWITPYDLSNNKGNKFISQGMQHVTLAGIANASLRILPKDSVLLSTRAPIGYMAIARNQLTTNQGFKSFIPNKGFSTLFIYFSIQSKLKTIIQHGSGSTFKEISASVLKSIKVCLPEKDIRENFSIATENILKRQNLLELENQQLTQLRDWLLPMLMNGQVKAA